MRIVGIYSKISVNTISLFFSIIILIIIESISINNKNIIINKKTDSNQKISLCQESNLSKTENTEIENSVQINNETKVENNENSKDLIWTLEIPKIGLKAQISEGTEEEVLNKYIGHFENTNRENGNIGLAAHNRGYPVNYFQNLKDLIIGDTINYYYENKLYEYEVYSTKIIDDTDWTVFDEQDFSTITLITCVENQPNYRRCIQGKLLK